MLPVWCYQSTVGYLLIRINIPFGFLRKKTDGLISNLDIISAYSHEHAKYTERLRLFLS